MRSFGGVLTLFLAFVALAVCQIENTNVQRSLSLTSQILEETILVAFSNKGSSPVSTYDLAIETPDHLSFLMAKEKKTNTKLPHSIVVQEGVRLARISLSAPLAPQESLTLSISLVYTHVFEPFPKEIPQVAKQQMRYLGNAHLFSPYPTLKTKTTLSFPSTEFTSSSTEFVPSGNKLTFGPSTTRIEPFSKSEVTVHFTNNARFLCTEQLTRTLEISHWGNNLAYEEDYKVVHGGAILKGFYSRLDYDKSVPMHQDTPVIKKIDFSLPIGASDVYYRDTIGNISTSHFHSTPFDATLELFPRFPLFGGWKTHWYHGYNVPLSNALQVTSDGRYVLNFQFIAPYEEAVIDELVLLVILPEGATDITFHSEFDLGVEETLENMKTYLDTYGRTVLRIVKKNVVNEHQVPVQVSYRYPAHLVLQEPLLLTSFFFSLFVLGMIFSRLDLSISKNPEEEKEELTRAVWKQVIGKEDLRRDAFSKLENGLEQFKSHKNEATYNNVKGEVLSELELLNKELDQAHARLKELHSSSAQSIDQLKALSQDRWAKTSAYHAEIIAAVKGKSTKKRAETADEDFQKASTEISQKVESILFA